MACKHGIQMRAMVSFMLEDPGAFEFHGFSRSCSPCSKVGEVEIGSSTGIIWYIYVLLNL